jgi:hypothetical protein
MKISQRITSFFSRLYCRLDERRYIIAGVPSDEDFGRPASDARDVNLSSYFTGKIITEWCEYLYDFGDNWCHDIKLIRVVSDKESFKRRLLAGEQACPPEDCGGLPGYKRMVNSSAQERGHARLLTTRPRQKA